MTGEARQRAGEGNGAAAGALEAVFQAAGGPLLMPYAVGGFPDPASCLEILRAYRAGGADLIEVGIPFSDPLADGPVIQAASHQALTRGVRPKDVLALAGDIVAEGVGVVILSYLNTILAYDPERFFGECGERGVLGVVVPDLPVEEAESMQQVAQSHGVDVVLLAAPTSPDARLARIGRAASGFIYCVSTTGVTGARSALDAGLPAFIDRLRGPHHSASGRRVRRVDPGSGRRSGGGRRRGDRGQRAGGPGRAGRKLRAGAERREADDRGDAGRCGNGAGGKRLVGYEHALTLQILFECLRPDAVEAGEVGEIVLADGEHVARRVVAQLAQETEIGLEGSTLVGRQLLETLESDAQRPAVAECALELRVVLHVEDGHGGLAVDGSEFIESFEAEAAFAALIGAEGGNHEGAARSLTDLQEAQSAILT